jgi:NADPH:quinone reductase-like Zn-dependent oxidoreductase
VVVAAGDSDAAQALLGKVVGVAGGEMFAQYRCVDAMQCLPLREGTTAAEGASCFVNPMTALGMVETMRMERHTALVHTAAASNLGQMLVRICQEDEIPLVNIVRKAEHVKLLSELGAEHIVNSSDDDFLDQLRSAIAATDAYCGFDPIGGGQMVDNCFKAMEQVAAKKMTEYSRYGSDQSKKMYIYGRLDFAPTLLTPAYGFGWTLSGWLLTPFLQKAGMETILRMRQRVLDGLTTTFASSYKRQVTLEEMLTKEAVLDYRAVKTGEKYLVTPQA